MPAFAPPAPNEIESDNRFIPPASDEVMSDFTPPSPDDVENGPDERDMLSNFQSQAQAQIDTGQRLDPLWRQINKNALAKEQATIAADPGELFRPTLPAPKAKPVWEEEKLGTADKLLAYSNPFRPLLGVEGAAQMQRSAYNAAAGLWDFATSPVGIGTLGVGRIKALAPIVKAVFAGDTIHSLWKQYPEIQKNWDGMGQAQRVDAVTQFVTTGVIGASLLTSLGGDVARGAPKAIKALRPNVIPKPAAPPPPLRRPGEGVPFRMAGEGRPEPQAVNVPEPLSPILPPSILASPTAPIGDQKNPDVIAEAMAQAEAARQQNKLDVAEADAQVRARLGDMAEGTKLDPESAQALIEAGGEMPRTEAVQFPVAEIKPEPAAVEPIAEPAPAATGATAQKMPGVTSHVANVQSLLSDLRTASQDFRASIEAGKPQWDKLNKSIEKAKKKFSANSSDSADYLVRVEQSSGGQAGKPSESLYVNVEITDPKTGDDIVPSFDQYRISSHDAGKNYSGGKPLPKEYEQSQSSTPAATGATAQKLPWEMTREEFLKRYQNVDEELVPVQAKEPKFNQRKELALTASEAEYSKSQELKSPLLDATGTPTAEFLKKLEPTDPRSSKYINLVRWLDENGHLRDTSVTILDTLTDKITGRRFGGLYDGESNTIYLGKSALENEARAARYFAHESVHAALLRKLRAIERNDWTAKAYRESDIEIYGRLKSLMESAVKQAESRGEKHYGLSNIHEFVSEAVTRPSFQRFLDSIKLEGESGWSRFVDLVKSLFQFSGDKTVLSETLRASGDLLESSVPTEGILRMVGDRTPLERLERRYATTISGEHKILRGLAGEASEDFLATRHKQHVEKALREGKPVPESVLADYPDLKPTPPAKPIPEQPSPQPVTPATKNYVARPGQKVTVPSGSTVTMDFTTKPTPAATGAKGGGKAPVMNMAGQVRQKRAPFAGPPAFETLHPKSQEKFNAAWDAKDAAGMDALLHPDNKGLRAEFAKRSGIKLPNTVGGTKQTIKSWSEGAFDKPTPPPPAATPKAGQAANVRLPQMSERESVVRKSKATYDPTVKDFVFESLVPLEARDKLGDTLTTNEVPKEGDRVYVKDAEDQALHGAVLLRSKPYDQLTQWEWLWLEGPSKGTIESHYGRTFYDPPKAATPKAEGEPGAKMDGMGGAVPTEFDQPGSYVSNMFAAIDKSRAEMGLEPMPDTVRRTWDQDNQRALAKMNKEPDWIPNLISEVTDRPRPLLSWEQAGMVWHRAKLKGEYDNALQRIARSHEDGLMDQVESAKLDAQSFEDAIQKLDEAVGRNGTGSEAGRSLQAQKMGAGPDFSLIEMRLQKRNSAHDGGPLTDAESAEIQRQYDAIKLKNDQLNQALSERDQKIAEMEVKRALDEVEKQAKQQPTYPPQVIAQAKRIVEQHRRFDTKPVFETLSSFFGEGPGMGAATAGEVGGGGAVKPMPAAVLNAAAIRYGQKIMDGANTRAAFDAAVKNDFGNKADPYLQQIWDAANKHVDEYLASFDKPLGKPTADKVKQKVKGTDLADKIASTKEAIAEKFAAAAAKKATPEITLLTQKLARHYVEQGIKDREVLIDTIWEDLKTIDPEFSRRETMDAISGYGDFKQLSKDEISLTLRDLKGQMQQLAKIEDMSRRVTGEPGPGPQKTGIERRIPTDTERNLIKLVNEAKKRGDYVITNPKTQLATALTARKTYYRNRLADLKQEISTRERIVKTKTPSPTDAELEGMKVEYAKLKEEHDNIFGQREITPEQRLKMALAAVERQIAEYDRRIKAGDFKRKDPFKIVNPALDAARARREALKAEFVELRGLDEAYASEQRTKGIEQQKAALERTIAGLELKLSSGDFAPKKQAVNRPADPTLEPLKQLRDELNQKLAEARKKPAAQKYAESLVRRLEAMNKRIAEKEAAIASGNVAVKPSAQSRPLSTPELELARQRLDELNRQIAEIRNPKKTDLERATQAAKTRLTNRIADLQDRLARGDFETRKRVPTDLSHDAEVMSLKSDLEVAHQAFLKGLHEDMLRKLNRRQKIWRGIKQGYGASVNIVSSFDLSAPRQLLFSILSNSTRLATTPKAGARVMVLPLARMLKAAVSEKTARDMEQQIKHRPNALSGVDKIAEIEYTDLSTDKFTRYEENAHSILDKWSEESFRRGNALKSTFLAPRTAGAKMVRASNRAFITALNQTRAALLDELLRVNFKDRPPTEVELKIIGNLVNVATGRGKMNPKTAERASTIFWAPKLMMSRAQTLALQPLLTGLLKNDFAATARARKIVAKEYARAIMGGALLYGVSQMFNDKEDRPLTSSDAGKVTRGKTRIDPWGGLQQFVVLVFRAVTGKSTNIKGKTEKIDDKYVLFTRFLRSKLHPVIGAAVDFGVGKNYVGQKWTPGQTVESLAVPLPLRDIKAIMRENGWSEGMIIWALGEFGMGVNVYDTNNQSKPGRY